MILSVSIISSFLSFAPQGAIGGVASFLYALKFKHYKHNKYIVKFSIEILGGAIVATFFSGLILSALANNDSLTLLIPFAVGLAWSRIVQNLRGWITEKVKDTLKNN